MLPDFPKTKEKMHKIWNFYLAQRVYFHLGILNQAVRYTNPEGSRWRLQQEDGSDTEEDYQEVESTFSINNSDIPDLTPDEIATYLDNMAQDIANQISQTFFKAIFSDERLKSIHSAEHPFDDETFLEALNAMLISFDPTGKPNMPSLVVSPQIGDSIKQQLVDWETDPGMQRKVDEILVRKREEWRAREASRKLVN